MEKTDSKEKIYKELEELQRKHVGPHIMFATRSIKKFLIRHLKENGLDIGFEQMGVIHILYISKKLSLNELSDIMDKDRGTVSRCVKSLCDKKYVTKQKSKEDSRVHIIKLTKQGQSLFQKFKLTFEKASQNPETVLNATETQQLHSLLDKIIDFCNHE